MSEATMIWRKSEPLRRRRRRGVQRSLVLGLDCLASVAVVCCVSILSSISAASCAKQEANVVTNTTISATASEKNLPTESVETYDLFKRLFDEHSPSQPQHHQRLHTLKKRHALRQQQLNQTSHAELAGHQQANRTAATGDATTGTKCQTVGGQLDSGGGTGGPAVEQHESYYQSFGPTQTRASSFVKPSFYTLRLKVDPTKRKFTGQLMITVDLVPGGSMSASAAPTSEEPGQTEGGGAPFARELGYRYITMHAGGNIHIRKAFYVFTSRKSIQIPATRIGRNADQELLTLDFYPNVLEPGQGLLLLVYTGLVNETESHGLFVHRSQKQRKQSSSTNGAGAKQQLPLINQQNKQQQLNDDLAGLATHMEPTFARRLLPSWDEPHLKARFNLIVVLPFRGYESLSNMPIKRKSISVSCSGEPLQEIEFHTTPTMSTYLLTLVIGRFEHIESITPNNCKVRAYFYANQTAASAAAASSAPLAPAQASAPASTPVSYLMSASYPHSSILATTNHSSTEELPPPLLQATTGLQQQDAIASANSSLSSPAISPSEVDANPADEQQHQRSQFLSPPTNQINHRRQAAQMALELAVKTFDRLETLLGVKYPLAKFDMIALRDFNSGGMENWGASIFHENYLLCDNASQADIRVNGGSNRPKRQIVPLVVAHEIAHQWFGNLLTAQSWNYLWLNEGFAQLLMYDVADALFPLENYWHIFIEDSRNSAMREDELVTTSRTLEYTAATDSDQLSLFDQLTYNKGAMVVRMLQILLGRRQLFAGLQSYLLKHSYDSVTSHDLFQALEESTGRADHQLESLVANWLHQDGYPLITVRVYDELSHWRLEMSQERFTLLPIEALRDANSQDNQTIDWARWTWSIPVVVSSELNPEPSLLEPLLDTSTAPMAGKSAPGVNYQRARNLGRAGSAAAQPVLSTQSTGFLLAQERSATLALPKSTTGSWFKLNSNANGYYRVHYEFSPAAPSSAATATSMTTTASQINQRQRRESAPNVVKSVDMLALMEPAVRIKSMCVIDRLNLIDDLFALTLAGKEPTSAYLQYVMRAYSEETELIVLRSIVGSLSRIRAIVSNGNVKLSAALDRFVQKYLNQVGANYRSSPSSSSSSSSSSSLPPTSTSPFDHQSRNHLHNQQQQQRQQFANASEPPDNQQQAAAPKELEELIGSTRVLFNDQQFQRQAADLFSRHFSRQTRQASSGNGASGSPLDSMDREMRASIYSAAAALMDARDSSASSLELASGRNFSLADLALSQSRASSGSPAQQAPGGYVTTTTSAAPPTSWLSSIFAQSQTPAPQPPLGANSSDKTAIKMMTAPSSSSSSSSPALASAAAPLESQDVFTKLLGAYETSESSGERYALSSALGSAHWPNKQLVLLNLTLHHGYFRQQDAQPLLDSMARSKLGRQHIWAALLAHSKTLEQRQLLAPFLKSLAHGLIESEAAPGEIEAQLRALYRRHSDQEKLIVQTLEMVRVNSLWFHRDRETLTRFLESEVAMDK